MLLVRRVPIFVELNFVELLSWLQMAADRFGTVTSVDALLDATGWYHSDGLRRGLIDGGGHSQTISTAYGKNLLMSAICKNLLSGTSRLRESYGYIGYSY